MLSSLEVRSNVSIKIGFLVLVLIHYHMYQPILITCVWILSDAEKNGKCKILTESDVDFHNIVFSALFNYMRVYRTLHILLLWLMN
jgi:hypothetical protein